MNTKIFFLVLAFIMLWQTNQAQISTKDYKIYSVKSQREVSVNEIITAMKDADVLFFGEEHNDSVMHYLESTIFELLIKQFGTSITLSMEMFTRDVQPVMDEYLMGLIREKDFLKDARVWGNYRDYKPMVELAKMNNLDVICANAAGRYSNMAGRKGQAVLMQLPDVSKKYFAPLPYDTAVGAYHQKLLNMMGHGAKDTTQKAPPMAMMGGFNIVLAQSLWDATMAYSIAEYLKSHDNKKVFQVNGRFHSDEGFAVVTQLKNQFPKAKILIISGGSDDEFPNINWKKLEHLGDFILITNPKVSKTYED